MQVRLIPVVFLILAACSQKSAVVKAPERPEWLIQKPTDTRYYYGIGHGLKDGKTNHIASAKSSALEDLIGEIRVNVSAASALTVLDAGKEFSEKYEQIIRTTVTDEIEEYELTGSWEDEKNYWTLYRLSKTKYREIKERKKQAAAAISLDFFEKAVKAESEANLAAGIGFYLKALAAIEKYLDEPVSVTTGGNSILLTTTILTNLQLLLNRITLQHNPVIAEIARRPAANNVPLAFSVTDKISGKPVADIPLTSSFTKGGGEMQEKYTSAAEGNQKLSLSRITSADPEQIITTRVDLESFAGTSPSEITRLILSRQIIPSATVTLKIKKIMIFLSGSEKILGNPKTGNRLSKFISNYMNLQGFGFTENSEAADLIMEVTSDTEKGGLSGSIHITYLNGSIRVSESARKGSKEIYRINLDRVKGYSLDFERSSQDACTKAIDLLEKEKLPQMLSVILQ